jgi:hypothetical protein
MKKYLLVLILIFSGFFSAENAKAGVLQSCEVGTLYCGQPAYDNYTMGYKFTPTANGQATKLCGYFSGYNQVKLYDSTYQLLRSAWVWANYNWSCSSITPVNVFKDQAYYVLVDINSGYYYCYRDPVSLPKACLGATINSLVFQPPSEYPYDMYGLVDVVLAGSFPSPYNTSGWAWSENIGWISFNSSNCDTDNDGYSNGQLGCPTNGTAMTNYGVNIDANGLISGYAWSDNIGWISFGDFNGDGNVDVNDTNITGSPCTPNCRAQANLTTGQVSGWARALSYGGGWDGWIRLRNDAKSYGVSIDKSTGYFSGYAWSDMVLGWLNFQGANYKVKTNFAFNLAPTANNLSVDPPSAQYCGVTGHPPITVNWHFSDPNTGDSQSAYQIQVFRTSDGQKVVDIGKKTDTCSGDCAAYTFQSSGEQLDWGTSYAWKIKVWDSKDLASDDWISGPAFTTSHQYPIPSFNLSNQKPNVGETVNATSTSQAFGGTTICPSCYLWEIIPTTAGTFITSNTIFNPKAKFSAAATLKLTVTDSSNYTCATTSPINTKPVVPDWIEVPPPSSFMDKFLATISNFLKF